MFFETNKEKDLARVAALLIYAAKIDENYSDKEEKIIKEALLKIGASKDELDKLVKEAKKIEESSNQILDFTREVKNMNIDNKIKIVETLWQIIYSDKNADIYETSLMRRLAGLLYIDSKTMGDIKERVKKKNL
tara:strand:- start:105 stop:506 length:402 start_codon:yes stop_codon:yes gene_type:complete